MKDRKSTFQLLVQEKKAVLVGMGTYYIFLILIFLALLNRTLEFRYFKLLFLNLLVFDAFLAIPAIPSSFIASYLSKKKIIGIYSVFVSGIILVSILVLIDLFLVFSILIRPLPADQWEELGRLMVFMFIIMSTIFVIFPTCALSANLAILTTQLFFFFHPPLKKQKEEPDFNI